MAEPAAPTDADTAPPKKGGGVKWLVIILITLIVLGGGGAAAWYFLGGGHPLAGTKATPAAPPKPPDPIFVAMESLTVNLQPEEDSDRYLQIAITIKSYDKNAEEAIASYAPELRSRMLLLLASKSPSDLYSQEGKAKLAKEIVEQCALVYKAVNKKSPVADVLFTNFVIQ